MAVLTLQDASGGIAALAMAAASGGGDQVPAGFGGGWELPVVLVARNGHTADQTVTVDGKPFVVPQGGGIAVIPVRGEAKFGTLKNITYSGVTALTVGAARLARL